MASEPSRSAHWQGDSNKARSPTLEVMNLVELHVQRGHLSHSASTCLRGGEMWPEIFEGEMKEGKQGGSGLLGRRNSTYKVCKLSHGSVEFSP